MYFPFSYIQTVWPRGLRRLTSQPEILSSSLGRCFFVFCLYFHEIYIDSKQQVQVLLKFAMN